MKSGPWIYIGNFVVMAPAQVLLKDPCPQGLGRIQTLRVQGLEYSALGPNHDVRNPYVETQSPHKIGTRTLRERNPGPTKTLSGRPSEVSAVAAGS